MTSHGVSHTSGKGAPTSQQTKVGLQHPEFRFTIWILVCRRACRFAHGDEYYTILQDSIVSPESPQRLEIKQQN